MKAFAVALLLALAQFSSRREVVRVDVLVTDGNRIVRGLTAADFEVRDSGVLQQVDMVSFEELPLNVALALDMSESVTGERLTHLRQAGRSLLAVLKPDDQAALVAFNNQITLAQGFTGDTVLLDRALDEVQPSGTTSLVDGVYGALALSPANAGRDLLLVFSDGLDTQSWLAPPVVVEVARRMETTVYGVNVRGSRRAPFLSDIAEATGGDTFEVGSTKDLGSTFVRVLDEFRQRYVVSYSPQGLGNRGVAKDGWHPLQVRVKGRRATVKARAGYFGQ